MTTTVDTDSYLSEDDSDAKYFQIYVPSWGTDGSNNALSSFLRIGATVTNPSTTWAATLLEQFTSATLGFFDDQRQRADGAYQAPTQSLPGVTGAVIAPDATGGSVPDTLTVGQREAETAKLESKGGWYDHSDGNRITTTQGDKVEVIRGNYQLIVLGRQDDVAHAAIMDASGGMFQPNDDTPANVMRLEWVRNYDGTWRSVEECQKGDVHTVIHGDVYEETYGQSVTLITGSETQPTIAAPETYGAVADGTADPPVTSELNDLFDPTTGNPSYLGAGVVLTEKNPTIVEKTWAASISTYTGSSACRVPTIAEETWAGSIHNTVNCSGDIVEVVTAAKKTETHNGELISTYNGASHDFRNGNFFELFEGRQESVRLGGSIQLCIGAATETFLGAGVEIFAGAKLEIDLGVSTAIAAGMKWELSEMKAGASLAEMKTSLTNAKTSLVANWTALKTNLASMNINLGV
jgi:hypothetical protein